MIGKSKVSAHHPKNKPKVKLAGGSIIVLPALQYIVFSGVAFIDYFLTLTVFFKQ